MPVPKKRRSKRSSRQHYAHWKLKLPQLSTCGHCGAAVYAHHVCQACGFYRGEFFKKAITAAAAPADRKKK